MAVVVPMLAVAASGAMATVAAGTAITSMAIAMQYVAVAGAVMSTVGMITDDKKLTKFGGLLSLGAGLGSLAAGAGSAASAAPDAAMTGAGEVGMVGSAGGEAAGAVLDASTDAAAAGAYSGGEMDGYFTRAAQEANKAADMAGGSIADAAGSSVADAAAEVAAERGLSLGGGEALNASGAMQIGDGSIAGQAWGHAALDSMADQSMVASPSASPGQAPSQPSLMDTNVSRQLQAQRIDPTASFQGRQLAAPSALQEQAKGLTLQDVLSKTNGFLKDNKELVKIGGSILESVYGPQAEQMDFQRSEFERRRRNMNSPIRLGNIGMGG